MDNVFFEKIDPNNLEQAEEFVSWYKNPIMLKNWVLQNENSIIEFRKEDFQKQFTSNSQSLETHAFMIKISEKYVGYGQFYINHPVAKTKDNRVCWPSIAIGNDNFRGKGFGLKVCQEILRLAKKLNCTHIEAGVFEFNQRMKDILLENGFTLIGTQKNKTFVDGKWWSSEHYLMKI
ncbi:MAG: GNAT family protein [Bdellovibrionota bacterium]